MSETRLLRRHISLANYSVRKVASRTNAIYSWYKDSYESCNRIHRAVVGARAWTEWRAGTSLWDRSIRPQSRWIMKVIHIQRRANFGFLTAVHEDLSVKLKISRCSLEWLILGEGYIYYNSRPRNSIVTRSIIGARHILINTWQKYSLSIW